MMQLSREMLAKAIVSIHRFVRFSWIYGPRRAAFKAAGRLRWGRATLMSLRPWPAARDVGVIGCGQFAFATIGYVITTRIGNCFFAHFDPDPEAARSFARFYGSRTRDSALAAIKDKRVRTVYVASNHASHADYAVAALEAGKDVYVEKPIAVTNQQLARLLRAREKATGRLFAGYNRPFSKAVRELKSACGAVDGPLTLSCVVAGHVLAGGHWYRRPEEGTRICGNVGHWLDLMVHILSWRGLPKAWQISCTWSNPSARDEDVVIALTSTRGDLVSIVITARSEPFEGISEQIFLQWGDVQATIDDFRRMTVHKGSRRVARRYWPKDVGHVAAIMQPFVDASRNFEEVVHSTRLMLAITEMVSTGTRLRDFSFAAESVAAEGMQS